MSTNPYSDNPYVAPSMPSSAPARPGGLTVVGVLAIVLGIMGLMGGCFGGIGLIATPMLQGAMQPQAGANPIEKMQFDLNQEMMAINQEYFIPQMTMLVLLLIIACCLTVGGIQVLRLRPGARKFLLYTFLALIAFELFRTVLQVFVQLQILPVVEEAMNRALRDAVGRKEEPILKMTVQMTYGFSIFGMVIVLIWALIKIIIYGLSSRYLSKPEIVSLFEGGVVEGSVVESSK